MPELSLIKGVGVELEGAAWPNGGCLNEFWKGDCSVGCYGECESHNSYSCRCGENDAGEAASHVLRSWDEIEEWVRDNWPGVHDHTCGLHLHVSTNVADYCRLMDPDFDAAYQVAMQGLMQELSPEDFALFSPRFEGENEFCYPDFCPKIGGGTQRYTQLNFTAFQRHGTLECRVFPMFEGGPDVALEAIAAFIECVEDYLDVHDQVIEHSALVTLDSSLLSALEV